jgi:hypothetical protein
MARRYFFGRDRDVRAERRVADATVNRRFRGRDTERGFLTTDFFWPRQSFVRHSSSLSVAKTHAFIARTDSHNSVQSGRENWARQSAMIARQSRSNRSPPIVSAKREYSRTRPETFGDFHLKIANPDLQRRKRMPERRGFPAHSRVSWGAWSNATLPGWGGRIRTSIWRIRIG